jgi:hypothetical protein
MTARCARPGLTKPPMPAMWGWHQECGYGRSQPAQPGQGGTRKGMRPIGNYTGKPGLKPYRRKGLS